MTQIDQRVTDLETRANELQNLSGGLIKLLFLSLAYHTQNGSLSEEQKQILKEKLNDFLDEPALELIFCDTEYTKEVTDIAKTMNLP